ncbi:MAG: class I SAM-dependent methyltransferase, partial [Leeuwenhoekiella sp.]
KNQLKSFELENVNVIVDDFKNSLEQLKTKSFNLIYFDGNHNKEATLLYFEKLLPTVTNESVWIFDDIYWSSEMTEAWEVIKNHPKITVTVDCFWLGFVFFRQEQKKEHFKIRL